jgi:hypothetical protein
MQSKSFRSAVDPWAVITTAVQRHLSAETYAQRLLTSTDKAAHASRDDGGWVQPVRVGDDSAWLERAAAARAVAHPCDGSVTRVQVLTQTLTGLLADLGWEPSLAQGCVEYIVDALCCGSSRAAVGGRLSRERTVPAVLGVPRESWLVVARELVGQIPRTGRVIRLGLIARLLLGHTLEEIAQDQRLVRALTAAAPEPIAG